jgi:hypothetical protein
MQPDSGKSMIGGILSIVSGAIGIILGIGLIVFIVFFMGIFTDPSFSQGEPLLEQMSALMIGMYSAMGGIGILLSILAIIGGVFALKKKYWGWALAGAIASTIIFFPCGIAAIILISLAYPEYSHGRT